MRGFLFPALQNNVFSVLQTETSVTCLLQRWSSRTLLNKYRACYQCDTAKLEYTHSFVFLYFHLVWFLKLLKTGLLIFLSPVIHISNFGYPKYSMAWYIYIYFFFARLNISVPCILTCLRRIWNAETVSRSGAHAGGTFPQSLYRRHCLNLHGV